MEHDEKIRMLKCPKCGNQIFPKIAPAVIVGVTDNDKILLTKYADREYKRYALIAGVYRDRRDYRRNSCKGSI